MSERPGRQQDSMFLTWSKYVDELSYDLQEIVKYGLETLIDNDSSDQLRFLDVGGGIGRAAALVANADERISVDVVDPSPLAEDHFEDHPKTKLIEGDFLRVELDGRYGAVLFRVVLHHLVAPLESPTDASTRANQLEALRRAKALLRPGGVICVLENYYEPIVGTDTAGRLIFEATRSKAIASVTRRLGANTAGEGVRFRSQKAWTSISDEAGLSLLERVQSPVWGKASPLWQNLPLLVRERHQAVTILESS